MKNTQFIKIICLASLLLFSINAGAQVLQIDSDIIDPESGNKRGSNTMYLTEVKMKVDNDVGKGNTTMIYHSNNEELIIINHNQNTFSRLTKEDVEELGKKMKIARQRMKSQMENMPPAQREMIKKQLDKMGGMGSDSNSKVQFEKTGETTTLKKWTAEKVKGTSEGSLSQEIWIAPYSELSFDKKYTEPMNSFFKMMKGLSNQMMPGVIDSYLDAQEEFNGFIVKSINYKDGNAENMTKVTNIKKISPSGDFWEIPEGYEEKDLMQQR